MKTFSVFALITLVIILLLTLCDELVYSEPEFPEDLDICELINDQANFSLYRCVYKDTDPMRVSNPTVCFVAMKYNHNISIDCP